MELTKNTNTQETSQHTIFHITEKYLTERYDIRYNTIKQSIEIKPIKAKQWDDLNENTLYIELQKNGIKCNINNLLAILKSQYVPNFNPIQQYFKSLKPYRDTEKDHIKELCTFIKSPDPQFEYHLKKWLARAVGCAITENYFNKQAFIIVNSGQNTGKSTLCRWLCPPLLSDYIAEDLTTDKDSRILLCKNFIINLDELSSLHRKEINSLKALFSKDKINERLPYDRKNSVLSRCCSFIGSTNLGEFLTDDTGSVRWLCFEVRKIDWNYSKKLNPDNIWRQALALWQNPNFIQNMTVEDIQENEKRNEKYQLLSIEQEMINKHFHPPVGNQVADFMTASDVTAKLNTWCAIKANKIMVGKALAALGFQKYKHAKEQRYGYDLVFEQPFNGQKE